MNKVYNVSHKDESTYYMVGAKNRNQAILNYISETGDEGEYIDFRAKLSKTVEGKPIETETNGLMNMEELMNKGFVIWWECEVCLGENIAYEPIDKYKCKDCNHISEIPFAE